jgi:hypothetical protein
LNKNLPKISSQIFYSHCVVLEIAKVRLRAFMGIRFCIPKKKKRNSSMANSGESDEAAKHQEAKLAAVQLLRGIPGSSASPLPSPSRESQGLKNLPKEVAISCSGCGFLGTYHFGVMMCFQRNAQVRLIRSVLNDFSPFQDLLSRVTRFAGASAGSLVATLMVLSPDSLEDGLRQMYEVGE